MWFTVRRGHRVALTACCLAAGIALSGCSSSSGGQHGDALLRISAPAAVTVTTTSVRGLGTVLVDGQGHALYMFPPDAGSRVTCTGPCAGTWPPFTIAAGHHAKAAGAAQANQLATIDDPNSGADIVTYAGFPLYRYAGDVTKDTANGQALFSDGGPWYVISPSGQPLTADPDTAS